MLYVKYRIKGKDAEDRVSKDNLIAFSVSPNGIAYKKSHHGMAVTIEVPYFVRDEEPQSKKLVRCLEVVKLNLDFSEERQELKVEQHAGPVTPQ